MSRGAAVADLRFPANYRQEIAAETHRPGVSRADTSLVPGPRSGPSMGASAARSARG
jgi:hypothetical protein